MRWQHILLFFYPVFPFVCFLSVYSRLHVWMHNTTTQTNILFLHSSHYSFAEEFTALLQFLLSYERSLHYKTLLNIALSTVHLWFIQTFYFFKDHHLNFHRMLSKIVALFLTRTWVSGHGSHLFHKLKVQIVRSVWLIGLTRSRYFPFFLECFLVGFIPQSILAIYIPPPFGRSVSSTCHQSHPPQSRSLLREGIKMDRAN